MKIFLSSTCYDLVDIRSMIEEQFKGSEHILLLSDQDSFPININNHRHQVCIDNISDCDLYILLINARYGSPFYKKKAISITHAEYREAVKLKKKILVFVRSSVFNERLTWIKNGRKDEFTPAFCDSINVFKFIDEIQKNKKGIWLSGFESVVNIIKTLKSTESILFSKASPTVNNSKNPFIELYTSLLLKGNDPFISFDEI